MKEKLGKSTILFLSVVGLANARKETTVTEGGVQHLV